jgi:hypothetical protein
LSFLKRSRASRKSRKPKPWAAQRPLLLDGAVQRPHIAGSTREEGEQGEHSAPASEDPDRRRRPALHHQDRGIRLLQARSECRHRHHDVVLSMRPAQAAFRTGEQEDSWTQREGLRSELPIPALKTARGLSRPSQSVAALHSAFVMQQRLRAPWSMDTPVVPSSMSAFGDLPLRARKFRSLLRPSTARGGRPGGSPAQWPAARRSAWGHSGVDRPGTGKARKLNAPGRPVMDARMRSTTQCLEELLGAPAMEICHFCDCLAAQVVHGAVTRSLTRRGYSRGKDCDNRTAYPAASG